MVVTDIADAPGSEVAAGIRDTGGNAIYIHQDVASEDDWAAVIERTLAEFG